MSRLTWIIIAVVVAIAVIVGIVVVAGGEEAQVGDGGASPSPSQETLVIAARTTPNGIDHDFFFSEEEHQIRSAIYENLMALGTTEGEGGLTVASYDVADLQGRLAESWEISNNDRTLTVTLRQGVMSHAGNELTAEDVQWTWDRSWAVNGAQAFYAQFVLLMEEPNWRAVDRYTWEITTPDPNPLLAVLMANNDLNIYDSVEAKTHATEEDEWAVEWLASNDAGHGPFTLEEWSPGSQVVLERFGDYYRDQPYFSRVVYRQVPEGSNRRALVEAGEVDIAENVPYRELDALEGTDSVAIWRTPGNRVFRFELNNEREPFNDARVRQAMLYATPQQDILDTVFFGFGNPLHGPVPSTYPGANTDLWTYDFNQERARELLQQAGVEEGTQFTITFDSESQLQRDTAAILRSAYEDVGFDVSLEEVSTATYTTNVYQREYQAFFLLEFPIIPDPGYALTLNYPSDSFLNSTGYSNERVDELLAQGFRTTDEVERGDIYDEIQQIMIADDPPEVWIAEPGWQLVTSPDLKGVNWDTPNIYWINELSR